MEQPDPGSVFGSFRCNTCFKQQLNPSNSFRIRVHNIIDFNKRINPSDLNQCRYCKLMCLCGGTRHLLAGGLSHSDLCIAVQNLLKFHNVNHLFEKYLPIAEKQTNNLSLHERVTNLIVKAVKETKIQPITDDEYEMLNFPMVCLICQEYRTIKLKSCSTCECVHYCKHHEAQFRRVHFIEHCKIYNIYYRMFEPPENLIPKIQPQNPDPQSLELILTFFNLFELINESLCEKILENPQMYNDFCKFLGVCKFTNVATILNVTRLTEFQHIFNKRSILNIYIMNSDESMRELMKDQCWLLFRWMKELEILDIHFISFTHNSEEEGMSFEKRYQFLPPLIVRDKKRKTYMQCYNVEENGIGIAIDGPPSNSDHFDDQILQGDFPIFPHELLEDAMQDLPNPSVSFNSKDLKGEGAVGGSAGDTVAGSTGDFASGFTGDFTDDFVNIITGDPTIGSASSSGNGSGNTTPTVASDNNKHQADTDEINLVELKTEENEKSTGKLSYQKKFVLPVEITKEIQVHPVSSNTTNCKGIKLVNIGYSGDSKDSADLVIFFNLNFKNDTLPTHWSWLIDFPENEGRYIRLAFTDNTEIVHNSNITFLTELCNANGLKIKRVTDCVRNPFCSGVPKRTKTSNDPNFYFENQFISIVIIESVIVLLESLTSSPETHKK